jgi:hypothetical protein
MLALKFVLAFVKANARVGSNTERRWIRQGLIKQFLGGGHEVRAGY